MTVQCPKLWWPNGYGAPTLHHLTLTTAVDGQPSDQRTLRFGMREITHELSLMNPAGDLRRVEVRYPLSASSKAPVVNLRGWNVKPARTRASGG